MASDFLLRFAFSLRIIVTSLHYSIYFYGHLSITVDESSALELQVQNVLLTWTEPHRLLFASRVVDLFKAFVLLLLPRASKLFQKQKSYPTALKIMMLLTNLKILANMIVLME